MKEIYNYIDSQKEALIAFTQELVKIPTVNPPGKNYSKLVSVLDKKCRSFGLTTKQVKVPVPFVKKNALDGDEPRIILLANNNNGAKKTLHLNGHYDVVPVDETKWQYDPFAAKIVGNKMFGRGTEDMKATIAAMLFAQEAIVKSGICPKINIEFSFVPDEETGSKTGFEYVVNKGMIQPDYAMGEGSCETNICHGNNGVLWAEVEITGKSAHASEPDKGENAFESMTAYANELMKLKKQIQKKKSKYNADSLNPARPSLVLGGTFAGGLKINMIPEDAVFTIDRRLIPEESIASVKKEIKDCINKTVIKANTKCKVKFTSASKPEVVSLKSPICKVAADAIKDVYKKKANFTISSGATDMRFLAQKGIPFIGYSVAGLGRMHAVNECIKINSLIKTAKVFAYIMMNIC